MADTVQRQELDIVLIVRNDKTTAWESSTYKLEKGELGIGYYDNGKVVVKIGAEDGSKTWKQCKQVEDILEKDLILTYNFGRHTTSNGFVNAGGNGMTVSEWLEDALSVTEDPDIVLPEASITASFTPSSGETGTRIELVNWNGTFTDGTYEFGSTETKTETDATKKKKANASATWVVKLNNTQIGTAEDGTWPQSLTMEDSQTKVTLSAEATLVTDAVRTPLNNVGAEVADLKVATYKDGTTKMTFSPAATVTGYRKMFCGCTNETLDSATIRGLSLKSAKAAKGAFEVTAPVGATQIVLALPTKSVGKKYTMTKAEMYTSNWEDYTSLFSSAQTIQVADVRGGENGLQDYNVYTYSFAALKAATRFQFTVAEANA